MKTETRLNWCRTSPKVCNGLPFPFWPVTAINSENNVATLCQFRRKRPGGKGSLFLGQTLFPGNMVGWHLSGSCQQRSLQERQNLLSKRGMQHRWNALHKNNCGEYEHQHIRRTYLKKSVHVRRGKRHQQRNDNSLNFITESPWTNPRTHLVFPGKLQGTRFLKGWKWCPVQVFENMKDC